MNQNVVTAVMNGQDFNEENYLSCQWVSQRLLEVKSPIGGFRRPVTSANRGHIEDKLTRLIAALNKRKAKSVDNVHRIID